MNGINIAYVVFGTLASLTACVFAVNKWITTVKRKWIAENEQTNVMRSLTESVDKLWQAIHDLRRQISEMKK